MLLVFQVFRVPADTVHLMITAIEDIQYFLRTHMETPRNFKEASFISSFRGYAKGMGPHLQDGRSLASRYSTFTIINAMEHICVAQYQGGHAT
jgi:hypothetical protein